jgi:hypothetical protein
MALRVASWRDVAAAAVAQQQAPGAEPSLDTFGLPVSLATDLRRLEGLPPPKGLEKAGNWRGVVLDALTIARDGWASKALALGWQPRDLFGIGPRDDWDFQGLAVWLDGNRMFLLDERRAVAVTCSGDRQYFVRGGMRHGTHPMIEPVMLWDFGRAQRAEGLCFSGSL